MKTIYYGRISTREGQKSDSQYDDAARQGVDAKHVHIDEGVSGYHVAPSDRREWKRVMDKLSDGGVLYVRWLDRISRRYDELHRVMQELMGMGVKVVCTLNGMSFDGNVTDPLLKATRDAVLAFMAAQGEADYINRREMQKRGIDIKKAAGGYPGRSKTVDPVTVKAWRAENKATIAVTADYFAISSATVKRYCAKPA